MIITAYEASKHSNTLEIPLPYFICTYESAYAYMHAHETAFRCPEPVLCQIADDDNSEIS